MKNKIFLGTILLEKNRWTSRIPSYRVSEWYERIVQDGFDGIELWENHFLKADAEEKSALISKAAPVAVFNTYDEFTDETKEYRLQTAAAINDLKAKAVKFNFGNDRSRIDEYVKNLVEWAALLPPDCRLLCECHPHTVMEHRDIATEVFNRLGDERYQAIIHVFESPESINPWFEALGSRIVHAHVRMTQDSAYLKLRKKPDKVKEGLDCMFRNGFNGTFTIEFTEGVRTPDENIDDLYACALDDMKFLRECLAQME